MAQIVNHQPLTTEARVHAQVSPRGICAAKSGSGTGFSLTCSVFAVNTIPPWLSILIYHLGNEQ